ncbi:hypothetical protein VNO78_10407 [Psophocarpus tetragonolobus]|uniref:Remorin C-terminal domain-containing protein n=1 Tax=Psophocarpus tetragonolobus TaxID=3891 RepID=A0AAN9SKP2_PSOTE
MPNVRCCVIASMYVMGETGKEVENAETSSGIRQDRSISPFHLLPTLTRTDTKDSVDRDAVLARVESEKRLALIKAWEESEKTKAENRAYKRHNAVVLWENSKKASAEAHLKRIEEKLDRNKAKCVEKMQNKVAEIHRTAEEKRAMIEAHKGEEFLEIEEKAARFRTRGYTPKKFLPCFGN